MTSLINGLMETDDNSESVAMEVHLLGVVLGMIYVRFIITVKQSNAELYLIFFTYIPCILILSKCFIHQLMFE